MEMKALYCGTIKDSTWQAAEWKRKSEIEAKNLLILKWHWKKRPEWMLLIKTKNVYKIVLFSFVDTMLNC